MVATLTDSTSQVREPKRPWVIDWEWQQGIQQRLALPIYNHVWPQADIVELDSQRQSALATALDIGGADKMVRFWDSGLAFLGQRFRRYRSWQRPDGTVYDDFTIRASRPSGRTTELAKILNALDRGGFISGFYAYGHVNADETAFARFRIVLFREFIQSVLSEVLPSRIANTDGSSGFYAWRFADIPARLLLYKVPQ